MEEEMGEWKGWEKWEGTGEGEGRRREKKKKGERGKREEGGMGGGEDHLIQRAVVKFNCLALPKHFD